MADVDTLGDGVEAIEVADKDDGGGDVAHGDKQGGVGDAGKEAANEQGGAGDAGKEAANDDAGGGNDDNDDDFTEVGEDDDFEHC